MATHFFTASSLDGFIATDEHSLDWLLTQDVDPDGPMGYYSFEKNIGALAMGSSTYEWVMKTRRRTMGLQSAHLGVHAPRDLAPGGCRCAADA